MKLKKGFTLLEILLVIALIGILASIIIVAINPTRQLAQARNFQREGHIKTINDAVSQYIVKTGDTPEGLAGWYKDICPVGGGSNCVDLSVLIPDYLSEIPTEPDGTPYQIALNPTTNKLSLRSGEAELGAEIVTNPLSPVATFAKQVGGTGWDSGNSVDYLNDGSILVTGAFEGTVIFGQGEPNQTPLISVGQSDVFIAKYNADGSLVWAKRAGGTLTEGNGEIDTFSDGSSVVMGEFQGTVIFGQGEPNQTSLISAGQNDVFIAKYNADGSLAWAKRAGGTNNEYSGGVGALLDGGSIITGSGFSSSVTFGQGESNQTTLNSSGNSEIFIAKYNADGSLAWAKRAGGNSADRAEEIAVFSDGSSIIGGIFYSIATFGQGEANQTLLTSTGGADIFIAKYNSNGNLVWARKDGNYTMDQEIWDITKQNDGGVVVVGWYEGIPTFGQGEPNQTTLTSAAGSYSGFIARYNADNTLAWAKRVVDSDFDGAYVVSSFNDGSVVVGGEFNATGVFGQGESNEVTLDSTVDGAGYLAKYAADGTFMWVKSGDEFNFAPQGTDISANINGSILSIGSFQFPTIFGQGGVNPIPMTSAGSWDMFIAKYNSEGLLE